jgi:hypothetical protein
MIVSFSELAGFDPNSCVKRVLWVQDRWVAGALLGKDNCCFSPVLVLSFCYLPFDVNQKNARFECFRAGYECIKVN